MSSDPRAERSIQSTLALASLLRTVVESDLLKPEQDLLDALKSQSSLAKYSNADLGVRAMSLNALKRACSACLENGFADLDLLRRQALSRVHHASQGQHNRRGSSDSTLIEDLRNQLRIAHEDLWNMSALLQRSMRQSRSYVDAARIERLQSLCAKEQAEIFSGLTLIKSRPGSK